MHKLAAVAGAVVVLQSPVALALDPFEIQVYEGDINEPRQLGLEVHQNFVPAGATPDSASGVGGEALYRVTLEPSLGVLEWWELGMYLQLAVETSSPDGHYGGFKLRSKWIVPRRMTGSFIVGINVEVGRGTAVFASDDWDTEFRPIVVWTRGRWMLAVNPMFGWALTGTDSGLEPDLEPALKGRIDTGLGFGAGLEYFAGLGRLSDLGVFAAQEHVLYAVADLLDADFDLNVGLGRGLSEAAPDWTAKAILGIGF